MTFIDFAPMLCVIGAFALGLPFLDRTRTSGRLIPCLFAIFLIVRMLIWRLTQTVLPFSFSMSGLWAYLFLSLEILSDLSGILFFFFLCRTIDRRPQARSPFSAILARRPSVAIFIPTYNEDQTILDRTILGAASQDYANVNVYVLDDMRRPWLAALCKERGVHYITRPDNQHAKAGNLNHALRHLAATDRACDFIAVLDADFVAQPNFISSALALFDDPQVGCVQTPQHFFNPDPLQHSFKSAKTWPDEQRFFFDVLLASKDAWGVAFSCGTSSICRWTALEQIGGVPVESVTEDMLLSIKLRTHGWKTHYLNQQLSTGLAPEGIKAYLTQRGRWCLGFMQIVRSKWGPFGSENVPFIERLSLIDAFLYWAVSFPFRLACIMSPIVYALFRVEMIHTDARHVIEYALPALAAQLIVVVWASHGRALPILSDASQLLAMTTTMKATIIGLFGSTNQKFKVTAKGTDSTRRVIQWEPMLPHLFLAIMTVASLSIYSVQNLVTYHDESLNSLWIFWAFYNLVVLAVACFACIELPRTQQERFETHEFVDVYVAGKRQRVKMRELSTEDALIECSNEAVPGQDVVIYFEDVGPISGHVEARRGGVSTVVFGSQPGLREKLLLKLFSGRYRSTAESNSFSHVMTGIVARILV